MKRTTGDPFIKSGNPQTQRQPSASYQKPVVEGSLKCLTRYLLLMLTTAWSFGADDNKPPAAEGKKAVRIAFLGHSFLNGQQELLPKMLELKKGWKVESIFALGVAESFAEQQLWDEGVIPKDANSGHGYYKALGTLQDFFKKGKVDYFIYLANGNGASATTYRTALLLRLVADDIRALDPDVKIIPMMTWGQRFDSLDGWSQDQDPKIAAYCSIYGLKSELDKLPRSPKPEDQKFNAYLLQKWENIKPFTMLEMAPCGEAWRTVFRDTSDLSVLFRSARHGDTHQNSWAAYLHACVLYAVITHEKFDGAGFSSTLKWAQPGDPDERRIVIPDAWARYLEDVAWRTYQEQSKIVVAKMKGEPPPESKTASTKGAQEIKAKRVVQKLDPQGQVVETRQYSGDQRLISRIAYTYTAKGLLESWTILDEQGAPLAKTSMAYEYDGLGNCIKSSQMDEAGQFLGGYEYTNDDNGNKISSTFLDQKRQTDSKYEYQYDDQKQLAQETFYNKLGKVASVKKYAYNKQGQLTEESANANDRREEDIKIQYRYADSGPQIHLPEARILRMKPAYNLPFSTSVTEYKYNEKGKVIEEQVYIVKETDKQLDSWTIYEYGPSK